MKGRKQRLSRAAETSEKLAKSLATATNGTEHSLNGSEEPERPDSSFREEGGSKHDDCEVCWSENEKSAVFRTFQRSRLTEQPVVDGTESVGLCAST
jgi:hypothetical protein